MTNRSFHIFKIVILILGSIINFPVFGKDFVIIYPVLHPFFKETSIGAREAADRFGDVNLTITGPYKQDPEEQIEIFNKFISQGVDAIAIGPTDDNKLIPYINIAIEQGIPILCIDTDAPESKRLAFIGTDNYQAGVEMARQVSMALNGRGKVVLAVNTMDMRNMIQRVNGFSSFITDKSEIEVYTIVEGFAESQKIYSSLENIISEINFDAIVTMDAESGPVVVKMWKAWGLGIPVFCFDDRPLVIEGIRDGIVNVAIVQNQYNWGIEAVETMNKATEGYSFPEFIDTGISILTKENIRELHKE